MTHWTPQLSHLPQMLLSIYLLALQQLERVIPIQFLFGTHVAKMAIMKEIKGKD
jgi:hypothetical protein